MHGEGFDQGARPDLGTGPVAGSVPGARPSAFGDLGTGAGHDDAQSAGTRRLARWAGAACCVALALTTLRVVQLKVAPSPRLEPAAGMRTSVRKEIAQRGEVLDRRGRPIAMSLVGYRLYCDPAFIYETGWDKARAAAKRQPGTEASCDPFRDAAAALAPVLKVPPQAIQELLRSNAERRYLVLAKDVDEAQVDALRTMDIDGVGLETKLVREYPAEGLAAQLVGKVGAEHKGQAGVEFAFERELAPVDGRVKALRDAFGRTLWINRDDFVPGDPGQDVRLTLDLAVQEIAERHLGAMVEKANAGGGRLIVMDAANGDILAMADVLQERPGWKEATRDPSRRIHPSLGRNRNFTDPYEPGSTFKSFVWARATELGAARPSEVIPLPNGPYVTSFGRAIRDVKYPGSVPWKTVLVKSLNGGMAQVAMRLKHQDLQRMVADFGFGQKVAIGVPGESSGIVTPSGKWSNYTQTSVAMGHEIAVTPIQMVRAFSAFARPDGTMVQPRLVLPRGTAGEVPGVPSKRVIDPKVLAEAKDAMQDVVEAGTARKAQSEHYRMYGKTGTAELSIPGQKGYDRDRYTASFIAASPFENPRIVVLGIIDDPDKRSKAGHFGGSIAGPVVRDVVDETLQYLGVPYDQAPKVAKK